MIGGVQNIGRIPELQRRILFTFGMLAVYRVGSHVATPGINPEVIKAAFARMSGTVFSLFNVFSGGALEQLSIFALGIMPYISASIIIQLLTIVVPQLEALRKEGEAGQRKITQYQRYGTIVLALFQGFLIASALEGGQFGEGAVVSPGWGFRLMCMITLTSGTAFIMWLGEQITERGIGNGISLVIFAGIVIRIPAALGQLFEMVQDRPVLAAPGAGAARAGRGDHRGRGVRRARAAPHPDPARAPRGGPAHDPGGHELLPAAREHGQRDPADLRLFDPDVPGDDRPVLEIAGRQRLLPGLPLRRAAGSTTCSTCR